MENNNITIEIVEQGSPEVPPLIKYISSKEVDGFDTSDSQLPSPTANVRLFFSVFLSRVLNCCGCNIKVFGVSETAL